MPSGREIIQPNQCRDFLGLSRQSTEWNDFIEGTDSYVGCIEMASRTIEDYIQNKVAVQEILNYQCDGTSLSELELPWYPIVRISGLTDTPRTPDVSKLQYRNSVSGGWLNIFSNNTDMTNYLYIDPYLPYKLCILENFLTFPNSGYGYKSIRVSYFAGYETIPGAIVQCCLEMCRDLKNQFAITAENNTTAIGDNRLGLSSRGDGGQTQSFIQMNDRWERMLNPFRKLVP